ncbi:MAG TPA: carbohydrate kinase, partial [Terriglobia bacterium]|nr:carbohydrate kinase [Terriglobia bacterium]
MIAVFDIGKTNKKLFVFDEDYNIVFETSAHLDETVDEDGDPCEDIHALTDWIRTTFREIKSDIRAINFATYGASFVHLGTDGLPCAPLYNYLKPFPEDLKARFYEAYG